MDKLLTKHKLPQLTQYKIDHWNSPITVKDIELIIYLFLFFNYRGLNGNGKNTIKK